MDARVLDAPAAVRSRPRLGFLGVGWIGCHRMQVLHAADIAEVALVADTSAEVAQKAAALVPGASVAPDVEHLLDSDIDGLVIATPSALHAEQSLRALERGIAVFCQKPLGRNAAEVRTVVEGARRAGKPLGVDLSYRETEAMRLIRNLVADGALGTVYDVDLVFHNAYGPDKAWFYDPALSGGGCVMDLGVHLVDLALWVLGWPQVTGVSSRLFAAGRPIDGTFSGVEDFASATIDLTGSATVRLACSWRLHAGQEAVISAAFHGTEGGATLRNVDGSFYDFVAERTRGTSREILCAPPDAWGGRPLVSWAERLAAGAGFDAEAEHHIIVAETLDRIYGRPVPG